MVQVYKVATNNKYEVAYAHLIGSLNDLELL